MPLLGGKGLIGNLGRRSSPVLVAQEKRAAEDWHGESTQASSTTRRKSAVPTPRREVTHEN